MRCFLAIAFVALLVFSIVPVGVSYADDESLGVVAGKAFNEVRDTTETTYEAASKQTQETAKEVEASWEKFAESLRKQWDEAVKNVQVATENFRAYINHE